MPFELPGNGWLLTGLDIPRRPEPDTLDEDQDETAEPLREFQCPPAPHLSRKHKYFAFPGSDRSNKHIISDWEKMAIISRLRKAHPVDENLFQQRLSSVKDRNGGEYISAVRTRAVECADEAARERAANFLIAEERRDEVYFRHTNRLELMHMEKTVLRAQSWYTIIVSHVFLTALIQERKVQEALETFSYLMAPMVKRFVTLKRRRREAADLTQAHLTSIPYPHPQVIQSMYGTFFNGWPAHLLEQLGAKARPQFLKAGSYLMHEGDVGRVMFMITTGEVSIILRKKGIDKRRTKSNSNGVFQIKAPCYVGEFALVCKEPRSASIYCETDIGFWAVLPEDYDEVAKFLSPTVASKQRDATDERRRQNLKRFFPLKVGFLRKFSYFEMFSDASLEKLIGNVEPIVLHDGDFLFEAGDMDSSVYFVQDGIAVMRDATGTETKVTTGSCVGMFECSCGVNERKRTSIVSINYCDVWRMQRDALIDVGMSEPSALLHCRGAAKKDRALEMVKEDRIPACLKGDPYLSFCLLPAHIMRLYEMCRPCVFLNGERLILMGQPITSFVVVISGTVDITVAVNGEQETFRMATASQQGAARRTNSDAMGITSLRGQTCVFGAYEFAVSFSQYTCTATSFGLTEAFIVDQQQFDTILPQELKSIMAGNKKARDLVTKAYKRGDFASLAANTENSFAHLYKVLKEQDKDKSRKR